MQRPCPHCVFAAARQLLLANLANLAKPLFLQLEYGSGFCPPDLVGVEATGPLPAVGPLTHIIERPGQHFVVAIEQFHPLIASLAVGWIVTLRFAKVCQENGCIKESRARRHFEFNQYSAASAFVLEMDLLCARLEFRIGRVQLSRQDNCFPAQRVLKVVASLRHHARKELFFDLK